MQLLTRRICYSHLPICPGRYQAILQGRQAIDWSAERASQTPVQRQKGREAQTERATSTSTECQAGALTGSVEAGTFARPTWIEPNPHRTLAVPEQAHSWDLRGSPAMDMEAADPEADALHALTMSDGAAGGADGGILEEVGVANDTNVGGQGCASDSLHTILRHILHAKLDSPQLIYPSR